MRTIIKINQKKIGNNKINSVLASELYKKLKIKEDFSKWIEDKLKQANLIKNSNYLTLVKNPNEKHLIKEYILTLESAKYITTMSGTPKSFEIRNYFIKIEKKYQKKLLKNFNKTLKSKMKKNANLSLELQKCKKSLKYYEKEQKFIKENSLFIFSRYKLKSTKSYQ